MKESNLSAVYPELPEILDEFVKQVKDILKDNLVGFYLVGSLAVGDFDLDSDIDFIVVTKHNLEKQTVDQLQKMHREIYDCNDCYPAKHLEGSYIPINKVCNPNTILKERFWYLDNGSRTLELSDHDNRWHVHWVLREKGIPLFGPAPKNFVEPIPENELKQDVLVIMDLVLEGFENELHESLGFYNSRFGWSYVILTFCRILQTLSIGRIESKKAGKDWAKANLDDKWQELIEQAWQEREGVRYCIKIRQRADQQILDKTSNFLKYVADETKKWRK